MHDGDMTYAVESNEKHDEIKKNACLKRPRFGEIIY